MTKLAGVAANFTRDLEQNYALIESLVQQARAEGVDFMVLPEAAIGGYLSSLGNHGDTAKTTSKSLPPAIRLDGPEIARIQEIVGDLLIAIGFCELDDDGETRYNAAAVLDGKNVYGTYRKVHQPLGEGMSYSPGSGYDVFDTPVGRVGLQICYDKAFPEAARIMALKGAQIIASLSAWPAARTATAENLQDDRWTYRFNLFDAARALDNQVFWIASNQSGTFGSLRYVGNAKVVDSRWKHLGDNTSRQWNGGSGRRCRCPRSARCVAACSTSATAGPTCTASSPTPMLTVRANGRSWLMPEMTFDVRWPDGRVQRCYSPSLVMHDHLTAGSNYTVEEFVDKSRRALHEASERVRAKFGFACTSAAWTTEEITSAASEFPPMATIRVVAMQPGLDAS